MEWKIVFAPEAINDLGAIVRHLAQSDSDCALRLGNALLNRVQILQRFPFAGSASNSRQGLRKLSFPPYLIFYRVHEGERRIDILRFWHGARNNPGA